MEKKQSKFVVVQDGNPRGKNISREEISQCLTDLSFFFSKHSSIKSKLGVPATKEQLQVLGALLAKLFKLKEPKIIPIGLEEILKKFNGGVQLHEGFITASCDQIQKLLEEKKGKKGWEANFIPFAKDQDENILVASIDNKEEEKEIKIWNEDGSVEVVGESMGLYLENLRNKILQKKLEYIEDVGLVAKV